MSMLAYMPWCKIDRRYVAGPLEIFPFERNSIVPDIDAASQCWVKAIMRSYNSIEGRRVHRAALVRYTNKSPIEELTQDEIDTLYELVTLACFSGLAARQYFSTPDAYCNTDCFTMYVQRFGDFTGLVTRRREGRTMSMWGIDDISMSIPVHCSTVQEVSLDEALLKALLTNRGQSNPEVWARWQSSISCFNQANTDSENVRYQVEWVLLCSAFQHLLDAESKAKDVAAKFTEALVPGEEVYVRDANRRSTNWSDEAKPLRYEWMREFYRIRGDFAHGILDTAQPMLWNPLEHLVLATVAFPLLVKCLLSRVGTYQLSDEDQVQVASFERFADTVDFLRPPPDRQSSMDSHWGRICGDRRRQITVQRAVEHYESLLAARREVDSGSEISQTDSEE